MKKVAAGIVTYNPDIGQLLLNIEAAEMQVEKIVIVDNKSQNVEDILSAAGKFRDIHVITNESNLGIAAALNQLAGYCFELGFEWIVTLDQDSVLPAGFIRNFDGMPAGDDTAIVCPAVHYEKTSVQDRFSQREEYEDINWCITSGAITNIPVLKKLGGFDEDMFIDLVDFEYCLRLGESGYRIIRANGFVLKQRLGDLVEKHIGKRRIFVTNHSPMRVYYYSRNLLYCSGKYPEKVGMGFVITDLLKKFIKILLYESDRGDKLKSMFKGIRDGIDMKSMRRN